MVERIHNHLKKIDQNQRVLTLFLLGVDGSLGHRLFGLQSFEFLLSFPNSHTHSEKGRWKRKIQFMLRKLDAKQLRPPTEPWMRVCWTVLVVHVGQTMKFSMQENRKSNQKSRTLHK